MKLLTTAVILSSLKICEGFASIDAISNINSIVRYDDACTKTSLHAATTGPFFGQFSKPFGDLTAARSKTPSKVIDPNYDLAYFFGVVGLLIILANPGESCSVSLSACLPSSYGVLAGGFHILIGCFFGYQTRKIRCVFDNSSFELKRFDLAPHDQLKSQGENFVLGGPNRWTYDTFVNWDFFPSKEIPILVYFKETQTPKELWTSPFGLDKVGGGQVHFFPAFANVRQLAEEFERRGCRKSDLSN